MIELKHRLLSASAALACGLAFAAQAQTASAPAAKLSHQDSSFMKDAAEAGNGEIEGSKLATAQASSADVKSFGQMLIDDHTKAGAELKALADQKAVKVSDKPSMVTQAELKLLSKRKGASFDEHYVDSVGVKDHEAAVKLFQKEADKGTDPDIKAWAAKTLPALQHHLEMARSLKAKTDAAAKS